MCLRVVANPMMNGRIIPASYQSLIGLGNPAVPREIRQPPPNAILTKFSPAYSRHAARNQAPLRRSVPADDVDGEAGGRRHPVNDAGAIPVVPAHPADRKAGLA